MRESSNLCWHCGVQCGVHLQKRKIDHKYEVRVRVRQHSYNMCPLPHNAGPSSSTAPPTLNPVPQKSAVPESPPTASPGPQPPLSTPSKDPGFSPLQVPDPHLYHQMGILLKQVQDMRALLGHLVMELRDLSVLLKLEATKGSAKYE